MTDTAITTSALDIFDEQAAAGDCACAATGSRSATGCATIR